MYEYEYVRYSQLYIVCIQYVTVLVGRGRAKHSKYLLIVGENQSSGWMAEKERVNECRNELMMEAVDSIAQMAPAEYAAAIEKFQQLMLASCAIQRCAQKPHIAAANNGTAEQYELLCFGCDKVSFSLCSD